MFRFNISWWDEREKLEEKGIVHGTDYGDAANRLVDYYGREHIISIELYELDDIVTDEDVTDTCAS